MAWTIEVTKPARKQLDALDPYNDDLFRTKLVRRRKQRRPTGHVADRRVYSAPAS